MKFIPAAVTRATAKAVLNTKTNSPKILFAAGVVGMGATVVTACRSTLRIEEVLTDAADKQAMIDLNLEKNEKYDEKDAEHDQLVLKKDIALGFVKLYAVPLGLGVGTLLCFTQAHRIQTRRIAGLSAALAIVSDAFDKYRERVRDELGDEKDKEFYYGVEEETIREKTESGTKTKKVKRPAGPSMYGRYFDQHNPNWQSNPNQNEAFLRAHQIYANQKLAENGYLFLNDVYIALGYEPTQAGQVVGWVRGHRAEAAKEEGKSPDQYVSFGFGDWPTAKDWSEGTERSVLLDFNVDGEVVKLIGSEV